MKLYEQEITVQVHHGIPRHIRWEKFKPPAVQVLEAEVQQIEEVWLWHGRWWLTPGLKGEERRYFRIKVATEAGTPLVMEIYEAAGQWRLSRLDD